MSDLMKYQQNELRLPSCGIPYEADKLRLINRDSVAVRRWLVQDDRDVKGVLKSVDVFKIYEFLLGRTLIEPNPRSVNLDQFLMSDVLAIMYMAKIFTWGPMADFPYVCSCGGENAPQVDLGTMMCKYALEDIPDYQATGLEIKLEGRALEVHLPTLADERKIGIRMKDMHRHGRVVDDDTDSMYVRAATLIDKVDGKDVPYVDEKFNMIMKWDMGSVRDLNMFLNERDAGILMDQFEHACSVCGRRNTLALSLTPTFFRPPASRSDDNGKESKADDVRELQLARHSDNDDPGVGRGLPDGDPDPQG